MPVSDSKLGFWGKIWKKAKEKREKKRKENIEKRKENIEKLKLQKIELRRKRKIKERDLLLRRREESMKDLVLQEKKQAKRIKLAYREHRLLVAYNKKRTKEIENKLKQLKWKIYDLRKLKSTSEKLKEIKKLRDEIDEKNKELDDVRKTDEYDREADDIGKGLLERMKKELDIDESKVPKVNQELEQLDQDRKSQIEKMEKEKKESKSVAAKEQDEEIKKLRGRLKDMGVELGPDGKVVKFPECPGDPGCKERKKKKRKLISDRRSIRKYKMKSPAKKREFGIDECPRYEQKECSEAFGCGWKNNACSRKWPDSKSASKDEDEGQAPGFWKFDSKKCSKYDGKRNDCVGADGCEWYKKKSTCITAKELEEIVASLQRRIRLLDKPAPFRFTSALQPPVLPLRQAKPRRLGFTSVLQPPVLSLRQAKSQYDHATEELQKFLSGWKTKLECDLKVCKKNEYTTMLKTATKLIPPKKISAEDIYNKYITEINVSNFVNALVVACKLEVTKKNLFETPSDFEKREQTWENNIKPVTCLQIPTRLKMMTARLEENAPDALKTLFRKKLEMLKRQIKRLDNLSRTTSRAFRDAMAEAAAKGYSIPR